MGKLMLDICLFLTSRPFLDFAFFSFVFHSLI